MVDSIFNDSTQLPEIISAAAKQLIENARGLGLTWSVRIATISDISTSGADVQTSITGIMDGDTIPIGLTNMSDTPLYSAQRVYVLIVPPSGNFIVGPANPLASKLGAACYNAISASAGSSVDGNLVQMPGPPSVTIVKRYTNTMLRFTLSLSYYTTVGQVNAIFGVLESGGTQVLVAKCYQNNGAFNIHTPIAGQGISAAGAGSQTWYAGWSHQGGPGTLTIDTGDYLNLCIEEYWP